MGSAWHALASPWSEPIMRHALAEVTIAGAACGALGVWVILYGLSYGAESLAHAMFPGLAVAALLSLPLALGGAGGLVLAGAGIALAGRVRGVGADNAVAVVVTALFGLGALLALSADSPPGLQSLLFGDVLGLTNGDVALAAALVAVVLALLAALHWRLLAVGFDRESARRLGIRPGAIDTALLLALALAIVVAVQGLGNLLVVALLVGPAATARLLARRIGPMMALAAALGAACGAAGLYASYHLDTAAGASIAAIMVLLYATVALTRGYHRS